MNTEKFIKIIEGHPKPEGGSLLDRLQKKDKELSAFYDQQHPIRKGFLLAEDIVRKWVYETHP